MDHITITEAGLRKLRDVPPKKTERLVADVQKQHAKLLKRIDRHIKEETRS